jgi:hypothetical protein
MMIPFKIFPAVLGYLCLSAIPVSAANPAAVDVAPLPETIAFNRDIRTIFSQTCFACHGPDANTREANLRLDVAEEATKPRKGGTPIVPGKAEESLAYQLMMAADTDDQMPPADFHTQLSSRDKALIKKWIDQGARYETHWAFIPPVRPAPPAVNHAAAVKNPIDNFIIAKLEQNGLAPTVPADRPTIIRRASLDLTGLPPSAADVANFVNDPAGEDEAYGKVVDRLMASPQFGEHFARHWLDTARYADTSGYQYDQIREQWVWRDWVINAFNSNMPFDQFTIEQNAGDLLPNATDQTRLATGFHRNHPITIEGGVIDEEYRTEYVMDRVVTTSTAWLGLTFLCARCHDHKYDPIGQDDFYSFYAFFNSVPERGLNGFDPKEKINSPLGQKSTVEITQKIAEAEKQYEAALAKVAGSLTEWEALLKKSVDSQTTSVAIDALSAAGETKLEKQDDGSVLATGPNPANQLYQIDFTLGNKPTKAIRLEAMTHDSLPNKSTGRAFNGNFVLSEIKIEVAPPGAPDSDFKSVTISGAEANYEQAGFPIAAAIDKNEGTGGWAIDGNTRFADSSAVLALQEEIAPSSRVRVKLVHNYGGAHSIGRFRLSIPVDGQVPVPASIQATLALDPSKRGRRTKRPLPPFSPGALDRPDLPRRTRNSSSSARS